MNKHQSKLEQDNKHKPKYQDEVFAIKQLSIEEAMEKVGQRNKYQIAVAAFSFATWLITTYGYMVFPFFLSAPDFECNIDGKWVSCTEDSGACDPNIKVNVLTEKSTTIAADFYLYCEKRGARVFIQSIPLFAGVLGTLFFGYISDKFGRRSSIISCWIMGVIFSILLNFSENVLSLIIGNFGVGFSALILQNLFVIHMNELSNGQFRVMALLGMYIFWSISEMQYIWMMKVLPAWKWNMLAFYTIPFCSLIVFAFKWIHDSPRYLYQKDRNRCIENLNLIAYYNEYQPISEKELQIYSGSMNPDYNYIDLFRYPSQRSNTIIISVIFLFVQFLYQGTQVVLNTVGNSFGENSLYVGIGELFGFAFSDLISHTIPRKQGIFYSLSATCLICISFYFYPVPDDCGGDDGTCWQSYFQGFMISLARAITSLTFGLELLLCGELYPATLKSLGYGLNLALGYFGTFLAPIAVDISKEFNFTPIVFLGVITFFGNFFTLLVTETINTQAPLDIPEVSNLCQSSDYNKSNQHPINQLQQEFVESQENEINEVPEKIQEKKYLNL